MSIRRSRDDDSGFRVCELRGIQRQQTGEISGVFGEMRIIRDAIRIEIERRKGGGE